MDAETATPMVAVLWVSNLNHFAISLRSKPGCRTRISQKTSIPRSQQLVLQLQVSLYLFLHRSVSLLVNHSQPAQTASPTLPPISFKEALCPQVQEATVCNSPGVSGNGIVRLAPMPKEASHLIGPLGRLFASTPITIPLAPPDPPTVNEPPFHRKNKGQVKMGTE